jgi:surfactin synthase thioesterase subunit
MFSSLSFAVNKKSGSTSASGVLACKPDEELASHPSCAVYGDRDTFTSQKKLRKWAENLQQKPNSQFHFFEIDGAGHFWQEKNLVERMTTSIQQWLATIDS